MNEPMVTRTLEMTVIRNDAECIRILTDANLLDKAVRVPPYNTTTMAFRHEGNYCLCFYREGFSNPDDNGYEIFQMPFESCSPLEAAFVFAELSSADTVAGTASRTMEMFQYRPVAAN